MFLKGVQRRYEFISKQKKSQEKQLALHYFIADKQK